MKSVISKIFIAILFSVLPSLAIAEPVLEADAKDESLVIVDQHFYWNVMTPPSYALEFDLRKCPAEATQVRLSFEGILSGAVTAKNLTSEITNNCLRMVDVIALKLTIPGIGAISSGIEHLEYNSLVLQPGEEKVLNGWKVSSVHLAKINNSAKAQKALFQSQSSAKLNSESTLRATFDLNVLRSTLQWDLNQCVPSNNEQYPYFAWIEQTCLGPEQRQQKER